MPDNRSIGRCEAFRAWVHSTDFFVYASHTLSSWGDRMWTFTLGIILVALAKGVLLNVAVYGVVVGLSIILFMALIGDWIDRSERLRVVKIALVIQNICVIAVSIILVFILMFQEKIRGTWNGLETLCFVVVVTGAVIARLASEAIKISIQKDWVVVLAHRDKSRLAKLNAILRRIDLVTNILAPMLIGQVLTFASLIAGTIFIAVWNAVSMVAEFNLLLVVYKREPDLAIKHNKGEDMASTDVHGEDEHHSDDDHHDDLHNDHKEEVTTKQKILTDENNKSSPDKIEVLEEEDYKSPYMTTTEVDTEMNKGCCRLMFDKFIRLYQGWGTYMRQEVVFAGLGLGCLYMTVLGFDSITIGFAYSQGVSESILGILMGVASIVGILGTFCFTRMRRKIGIERTGLFSFAFEIVCLVLCVVSIWTPGSPFIGYDGTGLPRNMETLVCPNLTVSTAVVNTTIPSTVSPVNSTTNTTSVRNRRDIHIVDQLPSFIGKNVNHLKFIQTNDILFYPNTIYEARHTVRKRQAVANSSMNMASDTQGNTTALPVLTTQAQPMTTPVTYQVVTDSGKDSCNVTVTNLTPHSKISVILLMAGIILARFGLWMADLSVSQILMENVAEEERGTVNGVQTAINMIMDVMKFIMVIIAPHQETYGVLIIISFIFICLGGISYSIYSRKVRGHLFHFDKASKACRGDNSDKPNKPVRKLATIYNDDESAATHSTVAV